MAVLDMMTLLDPKSAIYLFLGLATYILLLFTYRVLLHPLAKYPGPLSYKFSGWPLVWQAYKGDRHIWHLKDHEKYGPIVRIAPNTLSFNTASALNTIYGPRNANVKKGEWYKTFDIAAGTNSSFTESDKDIHATKRRWISPAFSVESQRLNEPLAIEIIERFCESLKPATHGWGPSWNITQITIYLGFDIMGAFVFGQDFRSVHELPNQDLANSILPASKFLYWVSYLPLAFVIRPLLRTRLFELIGGKPVTDNNRLIDYASSVIESRTCNEKENLKKGRGNQIDFLSHLVGHGDKKTGWQPTRADLDTECLNMINAGADPYSSVAAGMIFYLLHNLDALRKATSEVRNTFNTTEEIVSGPKLNSCTFLYACIEETLRRTAPVPSHLPRIVLSGGMDIDGCHIPEGTVVGVSAYAIHHHPTYFPDPWGFQPERWIESELVTTESIRNSRRAFDPFGMGVRQCIGKNLAYLQLKLSLAHILYRFDMRLDPGDPGRGGGGQTLGVGRERKDEFQMWDALGFVRDGPMVQFKNAQ